MSALWLLWLLFGVTFGACPTFRLEQALRVGRVSVTWCSVIVGILQSDSSNMTLDVFLPFWHKHSLWIKHVTGYVHWSWSAVSFFSLNRETGSSPRLNANDLPKRWSRPSTDNKSNKKRKINPSTQTDLTADWGGLACSASWNLPLKFNVPAPVIRDGKENVFTQVLMGKRQQFKLFTLYQPTNIIRIFLQFYM